VLTEGERETVMQELIEHIEISSKEEGTCRIRISQQIPFSNVELTTDNRAEIPVSSTNPEFLEVPLSFPRRATYV
jgi:hypothetical protein